MIRFIPIGGPVKGYGVYDLATGEEATVDNAQQALVAARVANHFQASEKVTVYRSGIRSIEIH